ncbi:hypothetical protein HYQ46_005879 [Verticillium longisporum]|nr:hypothetical protein HYQ46_005879 [Verticillium longisporum]
MALLYKNVFSDHFPSTSNAVSSSLHHCTNITTSQSLPLTSPPNMGADIPSEQWAQVIEKTGGHIVS